MSKHTPGPWSVVNEKHKKSGRLLTAVFPLDGDKDRWICRLAENPDLDFDEEQANARLLAAAPEMLEALKRLLAADDTLADEGDAEYMHSAIRAARAAIAKAEGRS